MEVETPSKGKSTRKEVGRLRAAVIALLVVVGALTWYTGYSMLGGTQPPKENPPLIKLLSVGQMSTLVGGS